MKRREFITLIGGAAVSSSPLPLRAQQSDRMRRISVVMVIAESDPDARPRVTAFEQRLHELGWTVGRNVRIDYRWPAPATAGTLSDFDRMLVHVKDLAEANPDAILATGTPTVAALKNATSTVPIIFVQLADPVGSGVVAGLARPGGNITGFTNFEYSIGGKWLEVLKEIAPRIGRVMFIFSPKNAAWPGFSRAIEAAASSFNVGVVTADVSDAPVGFLNSTSLRGRGIKTLGSSSRDRVASPHGFPQNS